MLNTLVHDAPSGSWEWTPENGSFTPDPDLGTLLGRQPADLDELRSLIHPDDQPAWDRALAEQLPDLQAAAINLGLRLRDPQGEWVHTLFRGRVIERNAAGAPRRMIGDHLILPHLLRLEQNLQERNESLELANEGINAGIWEWDVASGKTTWSPRLHELLGFEVGEVETNYDMFMNDLVHPDFRDGLRENLEAYLAHKGPYHYEFKCRRKDGSVRWFETHGAGKFDEHGNAIRLTGSLIDIDQRKKLEEHNLRSIDILTSHNQRLLNFAYIVSHNLRSHAANLLSLLEIFQGANDLEKQEIATHLQTNAEQLFETIEYLADVVKIQTDLDKKRDRLHFEEVARKVLNTLSPAVAESGVSISTDFSRAPEVDCIPAYLESILHNLLSNAIKYRHPKRPASCLLQTEPCPGGILLRCSDNGLGIDLERHRDKLFGLYKTFHGNANAKGVGLFLMKNQIESLGGSIRVESQPDLGTTFLLTFPEAP